MTKERARLNVDPPAKPDRLRGSDAGTHQTAAAPEDHGYVRPPMSDQTFIPEIFLTAHLRDRDISRSPFVTGGRVSAR